MRMKCKINQIDIWTFRNENHTTWLTFVPFQHYIKIFGQKIRDGAQWDILNNKNFSSLVVNLNNGKCNQPQAFKRFSRQPLKTDGNYGTGQDVLGL